MLNKKAKEGASRMRTPVPALWCNRHTWLLPSGNLLPTGRQAKKPTGWLKRYRWGSELGMKGPKANGQAKSRSWHSRVRSPAGEGFWGTDSPLPDTTFPRPHPRPRLTPCAQLPLTLSSSPGQSWTLLSTGHLCTTSWGSLERSPNVCPHQFFLGGTS